MQFSTITALFFASLAVATPTYSGPTYNPPTHNNPTYGGQPGGSQPDGGNGGKYQACGSGLYSQAQCCATDVLELAALDCAGVGAPIENAQNFVNLCAAKGQRARCCAIPVAGQALLCQEPQGTN